jgi:predicted nicotinamide N-methyase
MATVDPGSETATRGGCNRSVDEVRRRALQQRIARRYSVVRQQVSIRGLQVHFARIADPDDMARHMPDLTNPHDEPTWQPYWAAHWDASWAVSHALMDEPMQDRAVLDLGCGLGLTGAVAAACGARVWMADAAPPALLFARLNTWPWRDRVRIRRLDWRTDRLTPRRFDLIVGADIIYDRLDWPYLERFWTGHLAAGGQVLLGESGRRTGAQFPDWLRQRGWQVRMSLVQVAQCQQPLRIIRAVPRILPDTKGEKP